MIDYFCLHISLSSLTGTTRDTLLMLYIQYCPVQIPGSKATFYIFFLKPPFSLRAVLSCKERYILFSLTAFTSCLYELEIILSPLSLFVKEFINSSQILKSPSVNNVNLQVPAPLLTLILLSLQSPLQKCRKYRCKYNCQKSGYRNRKTAHRPFYFSDFQGLCRTDRMGCRSEGKSYCNRFVNSE